MELQQQALQMCCGCRDIILEVKFLPPNLWFTSQELNLGVQIKQGSQTCVFLMGSFLKDERRKGKLRNKNKNKSSCTPERLELLLVLLMSLFMEPSLYFGV